MSGNRQIAAAALLLSVGLLRRLRAGGKFFHLRYRSFQSSERAEWPAKLGNDFASLNGMLSISGRIDDQHFQCHSTYARASSEHRGVLEINNGRLHAAFDFIGQARLNCAGVAHCLLSIGRVAMPDVARPAAIALRGSRGVAYSASRA